MGNRSEHPELLSLITRRLERDGWHTVDPERLTVKREIYPDLLLERHGSYLAVCIGSLPDMLDRRAADRWEELLGLDRMSLMVATLDRKALKAARAAAAVRSLDVDVRYYRKKRRRAGAGKQDLFEPRHGLKWGTIAAAIIIVIVFLLLMSPAIRNMLHISDDYYRPFDRERQLQFQEQQEEE